MKPTKEMIEIGSFAAMVSNHCGAMCDGERVMVAEKKVAKP